MNRVHLLLIAVLSTGISNIGFAQHSDERQAYYDAAALKNAVVQLAANGDLEAYKTAITKDPASLNFQYERISKADEYDGESALHFAAKNGDMPMLEFLLESKINIHLGNVCGDTALHFAANKEVAATLIAAGAKVRASGNHGLTPLHNAKTKGVAETLLEAGAEIEERDHGFSAKSEGNTPLQTAASEGRTEVVEFLIKQGADVHATSAGHTALSFASGRHVETVKVLLAHGAQVNGFVGDRSPLEEAIWGCQTEIVKLLLKADADPFSAEDQHGWTLLHTAAIQSNCDAEMIEVLIDAGLDINKLTNSQDTALHLAAKYGNLEVAKVLLAHGAAIGKPNANKKTALMLSQEVEEFQYRMVATNRPQKEVREGQRNQLDQRNKRRQKIAALIEQKAAE